jgi:hypothetical protein
MGFKLPDMDDILKHPFVHEVILGEIEFCYSLQLSDPSNCLHARAFHEEKQVMIVCKINIRIHTTTTKN